MEANILVLIMNIGGGGARDARPVEEKAGGRLSGAARDGRESPRLLRPPAVSKCNDFPRDFHIEDERANLTLLMSEHYLERKN